MAHSAWAGICVLLPLLTNPSTVEKENRDGLDYVNSRIRYYVELEHLLWPDNLQRPGLKSEFESHIIDLYKHILKFQLKTSLRLYGKWLAQLGRDAIGYDNWKELLQTVKDKEQVVERESQQLYTSASLEKLEDIKERARKHYCFMQSSLQSLVSLGKDQLHESKRTNELLEDQHIIDLPTADEACYESCNVQDDPICEKGTRTRIQEKIVNWINQDVGEPVLWLHGPAGTGKSTIARTIASSLSTEKQLLAGYFFKRGEEGRNNIAKLFPTIAMQLVRHLEFFKGCLRPYINDYNKDALESQSLGTQFGELLFKPLADLPTDQGSSPFKVIIIDALDESECTPKQLSLIIKSLCRFQELRTLRLRVLLTSRSTPDIEEAFKSSPPELIHGLDLMDFSEESRIDIRIFLTKRFESLKEKALIKEKPWPAPETLDRLVCLATNPKPLFVYASTLCLFVEGHRFVEGDQKKKRQRDPKRYLKEWLELCDQNKSQLSQVYQPILAQAFPNEKDTCFKQQMQDLGGLILLAQPLSITSFASLLNRSEDEINPWLRELYAVLKIPREDDKPIELLHKSFSDFLINPDDTNTYQYRINPSETHAILAVKCVELMSNSGLKRDICNIRMAGTSRDEIKSQTINDCIPAELRYACMYWVHHLQRSKQAMNDRVDTFLRTHFLRWLEVLSLLGELSSGVVAVRELSIMIKGEANAPPELVHFVNDAYRFILSQKGGIEIAPLQTYSSALIFSPTNSLVKKLFRQETLVELELSPKVDANWSACLQTLEGHSDWVNSVAISPDSRRIISGSRDTTIKLWDAESGACLQTLKGHSGSVKSVAISLSDGRRIISGSSDGTLKLWDAESGTCLQTLKGHSDWVNSVAISPDSRRIISGSKDKTVKLWDAESGAYLRTLESHTASVTSVAISPDGRRVAFGWDAESGNYQQKAQGHFACVISMAISPDGHRIASGPDNKTVELWDAESDNYQRMLFTGHSDWVNSVAILPDSRRIISGSNDRTVKLWDAESGTSRTLKGRFASVYSIAISPDGRRIAFGSNDWTVKLWDGKSDNYQRTLEGHSGCVKSVAISPDGRRIASGSEDRTVKLWDAESDNHQQILFTGHLGEVSSMAFSSDGRRIVSGSSDKTVKLWDAESGACLRTLKGHSDYVASVAISPDGRKIASGSYDGTIRLWDAESDAESDACRQTRKPDFNAMCSISISSNGRKIAFGFIDKTVGLWDAESDTLQTFTGYRFEPRSVAISSDNRRLASCCYHGTVKLWDAETADCLHMFNFRPMRHFSFDPDYQYRLLSDIGDIIFDSSRVDSTPSNRGVLLTNASQAGYSISSDNLWITYKGRNLIWLPPDYRPSMSRTVGSTIAIGCDSGRVLVIRFAGTELVKHK